MTDAAPFRLWTGDDAPSLVLDCGGTPVDDLVLSRQTEPNGYFWEGVLTLLDPLLADSLELDSEADMFCAYGEISSLDRARVLLEPYVLEPERMASLLDRADAEGIDLDDLADPMPVGRPTLFSRLFRRHG
ncbi:Imm51 family immunity protein [Aeromicrobium endophyticum]|uniref:Immunity protein 51 of polymorphic toxin system n=1 Tax=Aeromicrobium endophyticum TaxID=2292704 RepID=A0A371P3U8_9ACTN|nr:Imm51 family immunity protein [Aeromicrobium endophyticum]REK70624.1 hypothetical protein DX116_16035 [Aeromicrobium endophyticum]